MFCLDAAVRLFDKGLHDDVKPVGKRGVNTTHTACPESKDIVEYAFAFLMVGIRNGVVLHWKQVWFHIRVLMVQKIRV